MAEKKNKNKNKNAEFSEELDATELSWKLFEKTKDVSFYRLYSAIKNDNKKE